MIRAAAVARVGATRLLHRPAATRPASTTAASAARADGTATAPPEDTKSYFVLRTAGQQLPVYQKKKNGGTRHLTEVRKITGRVEDLKAELQHSLALPDDRIRINPVNRHIVIKGLLKRQVAAYLEQQRF